MEMLFAVQTHAGQGTMYQMGV